MSPLDIRVCLRDPAVPSGCAREACIRRALAQRYYSGRARFATGSGALVRIDDTSVTNWACVCFLNVSILSLYSLSPRHMCRIATW